MKKQENAALVQALCVEENAEVDALVFCGFDDL